MSEQIGNLAPFSPQPGQSEQRFRIQDYGDQGGIQAGPIETLGSSGGSGDITQYTSAKVHTHPVGKIPAPSVIDIFDIGENRKFNGIFSDSYVIAADGTKFALHVSDANALHNFMTGNGATYDPVTNSYTNTNFYDSATNGFVSGSTLETSFNEAKNSFKSNNNLSDDAAHERALATILKESGITLLKAEANSNTFKKIGTEQEKNTDGTPKKDANGNNIYKNSDCP